MSFWGIELKPKKPYTLRFSDFQAPKLHLSQATLGNVKSDGRTIVRCAVTESPLVYVCSLRPEHAETCSLNLYFDEDVTFSVKGSSSVHLVGYFDGEFEGNNSGEDVESDGYSDEDEEEDSDINSMDDFIVSTDEDYDDEEGDDKDWYYKDNISRVPNGGVIIEELPSEETKAADRSMLCSGKIVQQSNRHSRILIMETSDQEQENDTGNALVQSKQVIASSEDEDGFPVIQKRKRNLRAATDAVDNDKEVEEREAAADQPMPDLSGEDMDNSSSGRTKKHKKAGSEVRTKEMVSHLPGETAEPEPLPVTVEQDTDTNSKKSSKKRKKKKKLKESLEGLLAATVAQTNGPTSTPSKETLPLRQEMDEEDQENLDRKKNLVKRKHPNGLEIENVQMGKPDGKQATPGRKIGMIYTGRLQSNGKIFDSNVGKKPFFFRLGVGEVIQGWDIGVNGMRVGDKRSLIIPPQMGYGSKGVPGIPPNSWLKFDVELVEAK